VTAASGRLRRFADLSQRVLDTPARLGPVRLVAVDGPTGSGKTTFADRLAGHLRSAGADVEQIHTDDLLDGWADMLDFWPRLEEGVLEPLSHGRPGAYHRYDWHVRRFEPSPRPVPVPTVLIVEGVSSARAIVRPRLSASVFLAAREALRLVRAVARDGDGIRAELLRWIEAERLYFARDDTARSVDAIVDGAPLLDHDPWTEYVQLDGCA
jgi:RecA/RadA recombinase